MSGAYENCWVLSIHFLPLETLIASQGTLVVETPPRDTQRAPRGHREAARLQGSNPASDPLLSSAVISGEARCLSETEISEMS